MDDYKVGSQIILLFNTRNSAGDLTTFSGSPAISIYKNNSVVQASTGVALTTDFDGITGLNLLVITTLSDGVFYSSGATFHVVVSSGTVGGSSVAGEVFYRFTLGMLGVNVSEQIAIDIETEANNWDVAVPTIRSGLATTASLNLVKAVTDKLDTMVVLDGAVYQFTANAVELAPSGGGGGGTIIISPLSSIGLDRVQGTTINLFQKELIAVSITVYDTNSNPVNLSTMTLDFIVATDSGKVLMEDTTVAVSGGSNNVATITPNATATAKPGTYLWSLRNQADGNRVIAHGVWVVNKTAYEVT